MDINELALTAGRAVIIYVFVLIVVRILGKRTVGNFSAFDLIVAFIISEVVDEPIYGDVPMVQALLVIAVVGALHYLNSFLSYRSPAIDKVTGGNPRVLIKNGKPDNAALAAEHINESDLQSMLREQQVDDMKEIKVATLEANGSLSVIKTEQAKEAQKGDLKDFQPKKPKQEK